MIERWLHPFAFFSTNYLALFTIAALCSAIGVFIVCKRVVFIGLALVESAALGAGFAFWSFGVIGASSAFGVWWHAVGVPISVLGFAMAATLVFAWRSTEGRVSREAIVGAGYAIAGGLALLLVWNSAEGLEELEHILSGDVLFVDRVRLEVLVVLTALVFVALALFRRPLLFSAFDRDMAASLGFRAELWNRLLFLTIGVSIALAAWTGGAMLVFALLVLPPVGALVLADRFWQALRLAIVFGLVGVSVGFWLAARYNEPTPPAIIAVLAGLLVLAALEWRTGRPVCRAVLALGLVVVIAASATALRDLVGAGDQRLRPRVPTPERLAQSQPDKEPGHEHGAGVDSSLEEALSSADPGQRKRAIEALAHTGGKNALELLRRALEDPDPELRLVVLEVLSKSAPRAEAAQTIHAAASSWPADLRLEAARRLAALGDRRAVDHLLGILADAQAPVFVRLEANELLSGLGRQDFGYDPAEPAESETNHHALDRWRHWIERHGSELEARLGQVRREGEAER